MNSKYRLEQTCRASPEQYDVYLDEQVVAYLRLRWGRFSARVPGSTGEEVFHAYPDGYGEYVGSFLSEEDREKYLTLALDAIEKFYSEKIADTDDFLARAPLIAGVACFGLPPTTQHTTFANLSEEARNVIVNAVLGEYEDGPPELSEEVKAEIAAWASSVE